MIFKREEVRTLTELKDGAYDVIIDRVFSNPDENNIKCKFKLGEERFYITMFIKTKQGEDNPYTSANVSDLLTCSNLQEMSDKNGYFPDLDNQEIGVLVKMVEYNEYKNIELIKFYDVKTGKTAYELEHNLAATYLDKKLDEMEVEDE